MGDPGNIVWTVLFGAAVTILLTIFSSRRRAAAWEGTVTAIKRRQVEKNRLEEDQAPITEEQVIIRFRKNSGREGKLVLPVYHFERDWSDLKVGDRLVKRGGRELPERA